MTRRERLSACAVLAGAVAALVLAQVISPAWIPSPASLRLARYAHYMSDQLWALIVAGVARVVGLAVLVGEVRTAWRSRRTGNRQAQRAHPALAGLALMLSAMSFAGTRSATNSGPARATPVSYELVLARSPTPRPPTPSTPNPSTYTVAPNDDLFVIAGKLWANPEAWPHLWVANRGGPAPGGRTFTDPKLIWPGQVLHVPTIHSGPLPRDWTQVPWSGTAGFGSTPSAEISAPPVAPGGNILTPVPGPSNQAADPPAAPQT
ncbi:MAG: LysM peptidoglycan-binding domain-containing protein, partial [Acidimicrobiales bacterium]